MTRRKSQETSQVRKRETCNCGQQGPGQENIPQQQGLLKGYKGSWMQQTRPGAAERQHPAILLCSTPHLFFLAIPMQLSRLLRFISWSKTGTAFPELSANLLQMLRSLITAVLRLPANAALIQGKEGSPALAGYSYALHALCSESTMIPAYKCSSYPGVKKSIFHLLLPSALSFPSA